MSRSGGSTASSTGSSSPSSRAVPACSSAGAAVRNARPNLVNFPVDYLARDFISFRNALLDFAAQRYPWSQTIEADAGVMLAEVMAALGDDLSYIQDRYAREAYLETATQRRSLRYHTQVSRLPATRRAVSRHISRPDGKGRCGRRDRRHVCRGRQPRLGARTGRAGQRLRAR